MRARAVAEIRKDRELIDVFLFHILERKEMTEERRADTSSSENPADVSREQGSPWQVSAATHRKSESYSSRRGCRTVNDDIFARRIGLGLVHGCVPDVADRHHDRRMEWICRGIL
jgi:hypothetical protein